MATRQQVSSRAGKRQRRLWDYRRGAAFYSTGRHDNLVRMTHARVTLFHQISAYRHRGRYLKSGVISWDIYGDCTLLLSLLLIFDSKPGFTRILDLLLSADRRLCTILPISVSQISGNLNTARRSVTRWILSEQNFENFPVRGRFSKKTQKKSSFNVLRLQAAITPQWLQSDRNSLPK